MKVSHRRFFIIFIIAVISTGVLSHSSGNTISIRSEGGSQIVRGDVAAAREEAIQNALRKAVRAHVNELVILSRAESGRLLPGVQARLDYYIAKYDVLEEGTQNNIIRIILDIELMPEKLVEQILDSGFLSSFRHKPRIMIALPTKQNALTTALEKGFLELGFHMIDALNTGNSNDIVATGKKLGADVVITGECLSERLESRMLGSFKSYRIEASLRAIGCDNGQILAAGDFEGVKPAMTRIKGERAASEQVAQSVIKEFPGNIIQIWATRVATGEIVLKPLPGSSAPPQITINSPTDGKLTTETVIRLVATVSDDQGESAVKLFINGASLALDKELHLSSEANGLLINRLVPLKPGENVISIHAFDQDKNKAEEELKVISNPAIMDELPVRIEIQTPRPGEKLSTRAPLVVGRVVSRLPINKQVEVMVNSKIIPSSRGMRRVQNKDIFSVPFEERIGLSPGMNEIEVIATTEAGQEFRKSISVSYVPKDDPLQIGKYAVIIGVSKYQDPNIRSLKFASADAESIYQLITDPEGGGFPEDNVRLLTDEQATREAIMQTIGEWLPEQAKSDDMVLLFYAGHGGVEVDLTGEESDGNSKYLIPYDSKLGGLFSTAILNSMMTTMLQRIQSNRMIFLIDCCYSGGTSNLAALAIRSISSPGTKVETDVYSDFSGSGRVIISASQPDQFSLELPEWNHGLFTYNLLRAISGAADYNKDNFVTLVSEIYPFVFREVSQMADSYGFKQNPKLRCDITGELILSKVVENILEGSQYEQ